MGHGGRFSSYSATTYTERELFSRSLRLFGIKTKSAATSGEQALEMFVQAIEENAPYDLVTLDYDVPGFSGAETAERIRSYEEENKIASLKPFSYILC